MDGPVSGRLVGAANTHTSRLLGFGIFEPIKRGEGRTRCGNLLYSEKNYGSASLDRTALKNRRVWVNGSRADELSLALLIKPRTMTEPEVGLKSNGLNKHYYLDRSPRQQFTKGANILTRK